MTHVELLQAEKKRYIEDATNKLDKALDWLRLHSDDWSDGFEEYYVSLVQQSAHSLSKALAIEDILIKLGVSN